MDNETEEPQIDAPEEDEYTLGRKAVAAILDAVDRDDRDTLVALMEPLHAADIADLLEQIGSYERTRLIRLYDLALLLTGTTCDWNALAAIARAARIAPALARVLQTAAATWSIALPADVARLGRPDMPARARCALLGVRAPAVRWLVDGLALDTPQATLAAWAGALAPDAPYRRWRRDVKRRRR